MKGEKIKEILHEEGISLSELAKALGYSNDQRLHSALKSDNVKSGLIEAIAAATNKNVYYYYNNKDNVNDSGGIVIQGNENLVTSLSERFADLLENKDEQINRLLKIIENMQK